jgi:hypothetical protein
MADEYGRMKWSSYKVAATAEANRRIEAAIASSATILDFSDLSAMTRLPDTLAKAQEVREIYAGATRATGPVGSPFARRRLTDISVMAGLTKLTSLDLSSAPVSDLSALSGLSGLTSLNLSYTLVSDLSALSGLSGLTSLNLSYTQVSDLSALSGLSLLTSLNLTSQPVSDLSDLSALSGLSGLTSLNLRNRRVSDLSALSGLSGLTSLQLGNTSVSDLSALSGLSGLTSLDLSDTQFSDLSVLSGLSALTSLNLRRTEVLDLSALSGLYALTFLDLSETPVSDLSVLSGLPALTSLNLSNTQVSDLGFLMSFPLFASEQAKGLRYHNTPAANPQADRRLYFFSRLPALLCAIETVQYLKGTHPDFSEPKTVNGVGNGAGLAARLAEASPVEVVLEGGLLQVRNAGAPERLAPKELGLRVTALREQVAALLVECPGKQVSQDIVRRFERYAKALGHEEVTYLLLDGPIAALRGGLNDPFMTSGLDGGFLGLWAELVKMHDELRPLLLPREADDTLELRDDVTPEEVLEVARKVEDALVEAEADGLVGSSMVEAVQASADYTQVAKSSPEEKRNWLKRSVVALGGVVAKVLEGFDRIGKLSLAAVKVQAFLATPWGQALVEALRPLLDDILESFFGTKRR